MNKGVNKYPPTDQDELPSEASGNQAVLETLRGGDIAIKRLHLAQAAVAAQFTLAMTLQHRWGGWWLLRNPLQVLFVQHIGAQKHFETSTRPAAPRGSGQKAEEGRCLELG